MGLPVHLQVNVPPVAVGVSVTVTFLPTELASLEPAIEISPAVLTVAPVTFPTAATEHEDVTFEGMLPKDW